MNGRWAYAEMTSKFTDALCATHADPPGISGFNHLVRPGVVSPVWTACNLKGGSRWSTCLATTLWPHLTNCVQTAAHRSVHLS